MTLDTRNRPDGNHHRYATWGAVVTALIALMAFTRTHELPAGQDKPRPPGGTILFSSLAPRGWDIYLADIGQPPHPQPLSPQAGARGDVGARRLTDHPALDYNATFSHDGQRVAFVSEREGNLELYAVNRDGTGLKRLTNDFALDDHPSWSPDGKRIAWSSTRQPSATPGQAWNAIYVMNVDGPGVQRLSPKGTVDYSPAWSPKGDWIACATAREGGGTDIAIMKPDGSGRRLLIKDGGWPAFSGDGEALYFHSKRQGNWGVWHVKLDGSGLERITPADVEAFTPHASADGKWLVAAVKRGQYRQIERIELATRKPTAVTKAQTDHWSPSLSADGQQVLYQRTAPDFIVPNVERWGSPPGHKFQMFRLAGAFPALAPDGKRLALVSGNFSQLDVMNLDGSDRKNLVTADARSLFSLSWAHTGDRIAFSHGTAFQGAEGKVDIETVAPDGSARQALTSKAGNNGFPSFSPDGKQLVFRSGRDGSKNLYIMNRDGSGVRQLTKGKWTDTMADWSPTGEWITFASDRDGNFEVWLIKPDGTGLRKLIGGGVRHNHPHFSPDGRWIVFTSQRAGVSAEEISLPRQPQAYGDLFAIKIDGDGLVRLTHNGFEEGTPAWSARTDVKPSQEGKKGKGDEY